MNTTIQVQKPTTPNDTPHRTNIRFLVLLLIVGCILGIVTMLCRLLSWMWLVEVVQSLGFWAFLITLIALNSPSPSQAFARNLVFMCAMTIAYYMTPFVLYGMFDSSSFVFWMIGSVLSSLFALVLRAKRKGTGSILIAALPLSVLFTELFFILFASLQNQINWFLFGWFTVLFHSIAIVVLLFLLPENNRYRLYSLLVALGIALVLSTLLVCLLPQ